MSVEVYKIFCVLKYLIRLELNLIFTIVVHLHTTKNTRREYITLYTLRNDLVAEFINIFLDPVK